MLAFEEDRSVSEVSVSAKQGENYTFRYVPDAGESLKAQPNFKTLFMKWGLHETMSFARFSYDPYLHVANIPTFLDSFFGSDDFAANFVTLREDGVWRPIGKVPKHNCSHQVEKINSNFTNLSLFDPLFEEKRGILRNNGSICGCFEEITDENELVRDMLQQVLFNPSHEEWDCLSETNVRKEFLYHILRHVVKGGPICQYEDEIQPYFDVCKAIYKEMVEVQRCKESPKDPDSSTALRVMSSVYRIYAIDGAEGRLFPSTNPQNFLYLSINPIKRQVSLWYNAFFA